MKNITKGTEPNSLTEHKKQEHADYDNYGDKDDLRVALVSEQKGICCYCMGRIAADSRKMKIEHFKCQDNHPDLQLNYNNLLGACMGNQGQRLRLQHCDTRKGNEEFSKKPSAPSILIENFIQYKGDGTIHSSDEILDSELNEALNLNLSFLKSNRKAVLDGFLLGLKKKKGTFQKPLLEKWLREWNGDDGQAILKPYCGVVIYWLRKRLKRP